jgi:hypothetical protein
MSRKPTRKKIPKGHGKTRIGSIWWDLTDGGGLIISPTKNGGYVITHVPPRQPVKISFVPSLMIRSGVMNAAKLGSMLRE